MANGMVNVDDKSPVSSVLHASSGGTFDTSNWTVATSGAKASGVPAGLPSWALYVAAGLAVVWALKRMKKG